MAKNDIIGLFCFGKEIGRIGFDEDRRTSTFQYHPDFLKAGDYSKLFPFIIKHTATAQLFNKYNNESFKGLPPMIADSLPDTFGNIIFKAWMENNHKDFERISIVEQLAYVGNRGMGALEYRPGKSIPKNANINLDEITDVLSRVLDQKSHTSGEKLDSAALLNIFKIGTSAGGARPKVLISQHKVTAMLIPGDLEYSADYEHYLVKLYIPETEYPYNRQTVEYCYYLTAIELGITMMPSKLIEEKHFATLRFDRQDGKKKHILTASGMTGWDFKDPVVSSYENLFELAVNLKISPKQIDELYKRMVFNVVFFNIDDHLKNHSFIYDEEYDRWDLSPAYDLTYALNAVIRVIRVNRVMSINGKRKDISLNDLLSVAEKFTVKKAKQIIESVQNAIPFWLQQARTYEIPENVITEMQKDFIRFEVK